MGIYQKKHPRKFFAGVYRWAFACYRTPTKANTNNPMNPTHGVIASDHALDAGEHGNPVLPCQQYLVQTRLTDTRVGNQLHPAIGNAYAYALAHPAHQVHIHRALRRERGAERRNQPSQFDGHHISLSRALSGRAAGP